ncbi:MAG: S-layer homology domain-containing protein [Lutisporaceae bacterium]
MKRYIVFLMSLVIVLASIMTAISADSNGSAAASDLQQLEQLESLGVFSRNSAGDLGAERPVTREEFAKVILYISGQESKAATYKNNSLFKDVKRDRWSNGYIGAVNAFGYLKSMPDGLFHPTDAVTYSQAAVVLGKLLGYTDNDLSGNWPYNYLTLMENLDIFEGIPYKASDSVSRKQMAVMLQRLLQSEIKGDSKLYVETTGVFKNIIVFENGTIRKDLDSKRVLTDTGVYYLKDGVAVPDAGKKYIARIEKGAITKLAMCEMEYTNVSVKIFSSGVVIQNGGNQTTLPQNVQYYYNGEKVDFSTVAAAVNTNSSIVIGYKAGEAQFAVLLDPVYSEPLVATSQMLGHYLEQLYGNKPITRGGKSITSAMLEVNNVIYEATDIWGKNGYIEVYNNEMSGEITAVLPNKLSPETISIDNQSYQLSSYFPKYKVNLSGNIEVDSRATILLGIDGKAVDIILNGTGINENYVLVLDAYKEESVDIQDFGDITCFVTLLHTDGSEKTYVTLEDKSLLKGGLGKYSILSDGTKYDTILLSSVESTSDSNLVFGVNKDERMLDSSYAADNIVIFNQINNIYGRKNDASVLRWSDLPNGKLEMGKVRYVHRTGDFGDIDVLFVDNVRDEQYAYGIVNGIVKTTSSGASVIQTISIMINGKEYTYTSTAMGINSGSVVKTRISEDKILTVEKQLIPYATISSIDAIDSSRIRLNGRTYSYHKDLAVYELGNGSVWDAVGISKLAKGALNNQVEIYLDKSIEFGGKVVMMIIK